MIEIFPPSGSKLKGTFKEMGTYVSVPVHHVRAYAEGLADDIKRSEGTLRLIYGIPKNGLIIAQQVARILQGQPNVQVDVLYSVYHVADAISREEDVLIIDDIIDSGATIERLKKMVLWMLNEMGKTDGESEGFDEALWAKHAIITAMFDKRDQRYAGNWYSFPWEDFEQGKTMDEFVQRLIQATGEDANREGLKDTPRRFLAAWGELTGGYSVDIDKLMTTFDNESEIDQIIGCKDIEFSSLCEHHLMPFTGKAHVYYIPDKKIIGLSKIPRIVDTFSRRLQNQERLTKDIADLMEKEIAPKAVAVIIEGQHSCMASRGIKARSASMTTSDMRGYFRSKPEAREELMQLIFSHH